MSEEKIAERIDANVLNIPIQDLADVTKTQFGKKVDKLKGKTTGKLIIKEYPTASAHVGHFRHLLQELDIKKDFKPDMIYIDYLNICASHRVMVQQMWNLQTPQSHLDYQQQQTLCLH